MRQVLEGSLRLLLRLGQGLQAGLGLLPENRQSLFGGFAVGFQQNVLDVYEVVPVGALRVCYLRLRQVIGQGGEVHIGSVQKLSHVGQCRLGGAEIILSHGRRVPKALLPCQGFQGVRQGIQIGLVHGVGAVKTVVAVEELGRRHTVHIGGILFRVGLILRLQIQGNLQALLIQSGGGMPSIQSLPEKILLPGAHGSVRLAGLAVQRRVKIRCRGFPGGLILRRCRPIPDGKGLIGQLGVPDLGDHRRRVSLPGVGSLAGHILRIAVGGNGRPCRWQGGFRRIVCVAARRGTATQKQHRKDCR